MAAHTKNKSSALKATKGTYTVYLSQRDIENGLDIQYDLNGYTIVTL